MELPDPAPDVREPNFPASMKTASDVRERFVAPPLITSHPRNEVPAKAGFSTVSLDFAASASASVL